MKASNFCTVSILFAVAALVFAASGSANAAYSITDIGIYDRSGSMDLNNAGQVVDYYGNTVNLYSNGRVTNLGNFGGQNPYARINNLGQIAISTNDSNLETTGYIYYTKNNTTQNIGSLGHAGKVTGFGDNGQIVGTYWAGNPNHNFVYQNGVFTDIGAWGQFTSYFVTNNNTGRIAGYADTSNKTAAYTSDSAGHGIFKIAFENNYTSRALDINDSGQVVGWAEEIYGGDVRHPVLYSGGTTWTDLLPILGASSGSAEAINNKGQIVGYLRSNDQSILYLYENGEWVDLNSLIPADSGWVITGVADINDNGQILGFGTHNGQEYQTFLLTPSSPVPIPQALYLFGSGIAGVGVFRRRLFRILDEL